MSTSLIEPIRSTICQCFPAFKDNVEWNLFIGEWFGDCVYTPREYFSFSLGILTLILNFISLGPQIWLNFKKKSTDGLSVGLLVIWIVADLASLAGCILTDQLVTQKLLAIYFVIIDSVTIFQCWYYAGPPTINTDTAEFSGQLSTEYGTEIPLKTYSSSTMDSPSKASSTYQQTDSSTSNANSNLFSGDFDNEFVRSSDQHSDEAELEKLLADPTAADLSPILTTQQQQQLNDQQQNINQGNTGKIKGKKTIMNPVVTSTLGIVSMICFIAMINVSTGSSSSSHISTVTDAVIDQLPSCVRENHSSEAGRFIGIIISWISGFLYCASRIPQIVNNYEFHELGIPLDGLSPAVFVITALGNVAYGVSVLLRNTIDREFWITTSPFLVGSFGTILFDIFILFQIHKYNQDFQQRKNAVHSSSRFDEDEL